MSDASIHLFANYSLDLARGCLTRDRVPIHLRRQSYEVLKYLVEHRGHLISKDQLIEKVWKGRAVTDGSLTKCIEEVREALGEKAKQYVRTERGRGYIFDPESTEQRPQAVNSEQLDIVSVLVEDDDIPTLSTNWLHQLQDRARPAVLTVFGLAIAAAAFALLYVNYFSRPAPQINSIAVLPFVNATADPNAQYVSDGLSESLIEELSKLPELRVIARSSTFTYKGREVDVREVGRTLGVRAVVTGRVEQRGDSLIVSTELVDA